MKDTCPKEYLIVPNGLSSAARQLAIKHNIAAHAAWESPASLHRMRPSTFLVRAGVLLYCLSFVKPNPSAPLGAGEWLLIAWDKKLLLVEAFDPYECPIVGRFDVLQAAEAWVKALHDDLTPFDNPANSYVYAPTLLEQNPDEQRKAWQRLELEAKELGYKYRLHEKHCYPNTYIEIHPMGRKWVFLIANTSNGGRYVGNPMALQAAKRLAMSKRYAPQVLADLGIAPLYTKGEQVIVINPTLGNAGTKGKRGTVMDRAYSLATVRLEGESIVRSYYAHHIQSLEAILYQVHETQTTPQGVQVGTAISPYMNAADACQWFKGWPHPAAETFVLGYSVDNVLATMHKGDLWLNWQNWASHD